MLIRSGSERGAVPQREMRAIPATRELGVSPRLGKETKEAISTFSSIPPAPRTAPAPMHETSQLASNMRGARDTSQHDVTTKRPPARPLADYDAFDTVPPPASSMPS